MPDALVKLKTGTIQKLEHEVNNAPEVPLDEGSVYFAVDTTNHIGKIVYDAPDGNNGVDRIVMSTQAEYAQTAGSATTATTASTAGSLVTPRGVDGVLFNGANDIIHYVVCETAGNVATKTATCSNFSSPLTTGARIMVKFNNTNTVDNPTLNISNTGAKPIYYKNTAIPTNHIIQNEVHEYVYDASLNSGSGAWSYVGTLSHEVGITIDDNSQTLFITSPIENGDGVSY